MPDTPPATGNGLMRRFWKEHGVKDPVRFAVFCMSMLPVPVLSTAATALDRHLQDVDFQKKLNEIWSHLESLNDLVARVDSMEEGLSQIAKTVDANPKLKDDVVQLLGDLGVELSQFKVVTDSNSYQEILDSLIRHSAVEISSAKNSQNLVAGSHFESQSVTLKASDNSRNTIRDSQFVGDAGGAVAVRGEAEQRGKTVMSESSLRIFQGNVKLTPGSSIRVSTRGKDERKG